MREHDTVLCIQDGTDLNFATRPGCEGLSIIGRNQTSAETLSRTGIMGRGCGVAVSVMADRGGTDRGLIAEGRW